MSLPNPNNTVESHIKHQHPTNTRDLCDTNIDHPHATSRKQPFVHPSRVAQIYSDAPTEEIGLSLTQVQDLKQRSLQRVQQTPPSSKSNLPPFVSGESIVGSVVRLSNHKAHRSRVRCSPPHPKAKDFFFVFGGHCVVLSSYGAHRGRFPSTWLALLPVFWVIISRSYHLESFYRTCLCTSLYPLRVTRANA